MNNYYQFSAAKDMSETKVIQYLVYDENKQLRPYMEFHDMAIDEVCNPYRDWWLRIEYDNASKCAVMGEQWRRMDADKDLYPYWQFTGTMNERECEDCIELEGKVFRIGDSDGDLIYPPLHFNCLCSAEQLDDQDISDQDLDITKPEESSELLDKYVDDQFKFNSGVSGMLPQEGSYFSVFNGVNNLDYRTFNLPRISDKYIP